MNIPWTVLVPLLDKTPDPEDVKPGWLGFTVFLLLAAAVAFLAFSLRKHLGRVNFDENGTRNAPDAPSDPTDGNGAPQDEHDEQDGHRPGV